MAIFRVEKTRDYTVMSNYHLKDRELSLKAKGLLSMMLSLPEEWNYTTRGLAAICKEGVDSIGSTIRELEGAGYIIRRRLRDEKGKITDTEYTIYERPIKQDKGKTDNGKPNPQKPRTNEPCSPNPHTENPYMDNPDTDEPYTENTAQLNTNQTNPKKSITHGLSIHQSIPGTQKELSTTRTSKPDWAGRAEKAPALLAHAAWMDRIDEIETYRSMIMDNIEYEILKERHSVERLDEVVELMLETVLSKRDSIRIAGDDFPTEVVKSRILKLNFTHIEYVFDCIDKNTTKVRNIKAYMLTALYNAPATIDSYYRAEVSHDLYGN